MKQTIQTLAFRIHHTIPPGIRNSYRFLIVFFKKLGRYVLPVSHYRCRLEETGESFFLAHVGRDQRLGAYWLNRISDSYEKVGRRRNILRKNISRYLRHHQEFADLALVEVGKNIDPGTYAGGFLLPRWMELEVNIESALRKSKMKNIIRNIKKRSLNYEIRKGIEAFDLFYHHMYSPFVLLRHGTSAEIADYKHFSGKYQNEESELFFILKDNQPVASAYIELKKQQVRVSAIGILHADEQIFRMGVIGAIYYFVMTYYQDRGSHSILLGNSMPVVFDGVTEFKMMFGGFPYGLDLPGKEKFIVLLQNPNAAVFSVLKSNPLLHLSGNGLHLAVFAEDQDFEDKEVFLRFIKRLRIRHFEKTVVYYKNRNTRIKDWCSEEGFGKVEFSMLS